LLDAFKRIQGLNNETEVGIGGAMLYAVPYELSDKANKRILMIKD
jgi:hypothetical protein